MKVVQTISDLRSALPGPGACVFVPTMGSLHDGHLALVRRACQHGLPVVTSIFVNRLQFAPNEDFDRYPRTLQRDADLLHEAGCNILFAPEEKELYPQPQVFMVQPDATLAGILEGHFRPGFFTGVSTVVMKLFTVVQPRVAIFGKKDYQQLMVIRQMVKQFEMPITIEAGETTRTDDGLALSSRNAYLSDAERQRAIVLSQTLRKLAEDYRADPGALQALESKALRELTAKGWQPDYLTVRRRTDLQPPTADDARAPLVALGAARLGATRLIDNVEF